MKEWLPDDIMYLIMCKLMVFPIYIARLSAVCKRWHRLVCGLWPKLLQEHPITPLILLLDDAFKEEEGMMKQISCQIYNLTGGPPLQVNSLLRCYLPFRTIGSSFGWLIIASDYNTSVSLFNPLSKSHIRLPPLECIFTRVKGVLSKPPPGSEDEDDQQFDIGITMKPGGLGSCGNCIALLHVEKIGKIESLRWKYRRVDGILDVNSIGGRICILNTKGMITCYRWSANKLYNYDVVIKEWDIDVTDHIFMYLLESSSSEPLVILRYNDYTSSSIICFKILTLTSSTSGNDGLEINGFNKTWNWTEDNPQHPSVLNWTEIKSLGNDVIFLADNTSICIQAPKLAGSIYFSDYKGPVQATVFGVFNFDRNSVTHFSPLQDDSTKVFQRTPIWFLPQPYDEILKFSSIG